MYVNAGPYLIRNYPTHYRLDLRCYHTQNELQSPTDQMSIFEQGKHRSHNFICLCVMWNRPSQIGRVH